MPYIKPDQRTDIDRFVNILLDAVVGADRIVDVHPGILNYTISKFLHEYIEFQELSYANINKIMGVLDCVGKEFYRTVAAPYEDKKRAENGSVSELDEEKNDGTK